jgi:hypothetical protein
MASKRPRRLTTERRGFFILAQARTCAAINHLPIITSDAVTTAQAVSPFLNIKLSDRFVGDGRCQDKP